MAQPLNEKLLAYFSELTNRYGVLIYPVFVKKPYNSTWVTISFQVQKDGSPAIAFKIANDTFPSSSNFEGPFSILKKIIEDTYLHSKEFARALEKCKLTRAEPIKEQADAVADIIVREMDNHPYIKNYEVIPVLSKSILWDVSINDKNTGLIIKVNDKMFKERPYFFRNISKFKGVRESIQKVAELIKYGLENSKTVVEQTTRDEIERATVEIVGKMKPSRELSKIKWERNPKFLGQCTYGGQITYNPDILYAPFDVAVYVVYHEVCHLTHLDHSRKFWNLFDSVMPDHRARKNEMNKILTALNIKNLDVG